MRRNERMKEFEGGRRPTTGRSGTKGEMSRQIRLEFEWMLTTERSIISVGKERMILLFNSTILQGDLWDSRKGCGQMAPAVVNDAGWMTRSEGSKSTRKRESHNNGLPYDDHVMSGRGSLMYFEEIKRRPSKMVKQQQLKMIKETRETREKNH